MGECGVEGLAQRSHVPCGLGQEESALEGGHQGGGELVDIGVGPQPTAIAHGGEAVVELCPPAGEAVGDGVAHLEVGLEDLGGQ